MIRRAGRGGGTGGTKPKANKNAMAIARWEENNTSWLNGEFFALTRKDEHLQNLVGDGGTLWIVVSRPAAPDDDGGTGRSPGRLYSLEFQLEQCERREFPQAAKRRTHGVQGDANLSRHFATNDARLLLMSLRFESDRPIRRVGSIGTSFRVPRPLSSQDVELLEEHSVVIDRWSVVISYHRLDSDKAVRIADALTRRGISTFIDIRGIEPGSTWREEVNRAVTSARYLLLLVGAATHERPEVQHELRLAKESDVPVIPVFAGDSFDNWPAEFSWLRSHHALTYEDPEWSQFVDRLVQAARSHTVPR